MRGARDLGADKVHARDLFDARFDASQLLRRQNSLEDETGVRERCERDIDRRGDVIIIKQGENAPLGLRPLLSLVDRITTFFENPEEIMVALAQNAAGAERVERRFAHSGRMTR
jgi:hypothetical protein